MQLWLIRGQVVETFPVGTNSDPERLKLLRDFSPLIRIRSEDHTQLDPGTQLYFRFRRLSSENIPQFSFGAFCGKSLFQKMNSSELQTRIQKELQGSGKISNALRVSQNWVKSGKKGIPKVIMQTWKNDQVPEQWKDSPGSFQKVMPDWTYVLMTDQDNLEFVKKFFPHFLKTYQELPYPIMRADAIRYMWLYVIGGIYSDLDYKLQKDMTGLFMESDSPLYLVQSGNIHMVTNSFMASKPGVETWKEALSTISLRSNPKHRPWWFFSKHWKVMGTTGPMMLQAVVDQTEVPYTAMPSKLINPCSLCELEFGEVCTGEKVNRAYLTQLRGSSWHSDDSSLINNVFCRPREMTLASLLILGLGLALVIYAFKCGGTKMGWITIGILLILLVVMLAPKIFI